MLSLLEIIFGIKRRQLNISNQKKITSTFKFISGSPGSGTGIFEIKNSNYKVGVINLMGNVFMKKCENVFEEIRKVEKKLF